MVGVRKYADPFIRKHFHCEKVLTRLECVQIFHILKSTRCVRLKLRTHKPYLIFEVQGDDHKIAEEFPANFPNFDQHNVPDGYFIDSSHYAITAH